MKETLIIVEWLFDLTLELPQAKITSLQTKIKKR